MALGLALSLTGPSSAAPSRTWKSVSAGYEHTCAIDSTSHLWCWGSNSIGALGIGTEGGNFPTPQQVGTKTWKAVSTGAAFTCAIDTKSRLWCWGDGHFGKLGSTVPDDYSPVPVLVPQARTWTKVSLGDSFGCAIDDVKRLFCWGQSTVGQTGTGTNAMTNPTPTRVGTGGWKSIAAGSNHACAIALDDRPWCWGGNGSGQLNNGLYGNQEKSLVPIRVRPKDWTKVTAGGQHTCVTTTAADVYCWGSDSNGQIGSGGAPDSQTTRIKIGTTKTVGAVVDAGFAYTCGISTTHVLRCWGQNSAGQLGDGTTDGRNVPTKSATTIKDWAKLSAGGDHACAIRANGALYCWGKGDHGEVGAGDLGGRTAPARVF